jgi:iron complex outermembrane receptor protein
MTARWKPFVYSACLVFLGIGSAAADPAPKSLRMRSHRVDVQQARKVQQRRPLRVAQPEPAPTDPAPTPPDGSAPPPDGTAVPPPEPTPPTPAPEPTPTPTPAPEVTATPNLTDEELAKLAEQEATKEEIIVVTGSTIERRELTTASPISVLDKADIDSAGLATIGDVLQNLPANSNAINAQVNNGGDGATRVDLRGLGSNRTLVLLNGRRVVPGGTGADASVDLNAIPLAVIERLEVLKDGASAVYGSDAIGGVVNIITRQDFDGTEASLYTGTSQKGDGFTYDMSFVSGASSKKGNIVVSGGWQHQDPVFAGDRSFSEFDKSWDYASHTSSNGGSSATPNGRINPASIDRDRDGSPDTPAMPLCGVTSSGAPKPCKPNGSGGWDPFVGTGSTDGGDLFNFQPDNYLFTPSQRYNAFAEGHYEVTKSTKVFFEALYLNRKSNQQLASEPFLANTVISGDSIYNNTGGDIYDYRRRLQEFGPRASFQNIDTFRIVTGIGGKFDESAGPFKNWKWEASYNYGHTEGINRNVGNLILSRLTNALGPSFIDANGVPRCGDAATQTVIPGCVPMNIMGKAGSIDPAARDYVTFTGVSTGFNDQKTALLQTSGRLAKLPNGGDISMAVGGDYRREAGGFTPDPLTSTGDTTGNAQAPTGGSYNAFEAFAEVSLVPISGQKLAEWVELNLAARAFRYNTFGSGVTWKAGGLFKTAGGIAVRGTYSTAFRAPSVGELFQGKADDFPTATDPCDEIDTPLTPGSVAEKRCREQGVQQGFTSGSSQQRAVIGGNANLKAETANVLTAGLVYESPQLKGFSVTLDYFNIKIKDAIQSLGAQVILANCYTRDQQDACDQIHRDAATHSIDFIDDPVSNVGGTNTDGIDYAIAYEHKNKDAGHFRYQLEGQWLHAIDLDNAVDVLHGVGVYDLGAYPRWKTNFSTMWDKSGVNAGFNVRIIGSFAECDNNDCNSIDPDTNKRVNGTRTVDRSYTGDVYAGYTVKGKAGTTHVQLGVNNVTNANPPTIYVGFQADSDASTYDYMGRYFYARLTQLF